ncbi:aminomethyl-transferring glycine dehydrogenase [bacterium SCSIO 12741]|nr:aminomethyl-transferring glycine dehydrogenase [bacterium SCSIO 12741]
MGVNQFSTRHIGPRGENVSEMLKAVGASSIDQLIEETIPPAIRLKKELNLPNGISESEYLKEIADVASKNKMFRTFIGQGYYGTITPSVIRRNIFENPGWYTAYTPYQAEISQGRLEALLNFQTMVSDLTGMEMANASLLDEATAAAEAMIMFFHARSRKDVKAGKNKFFVDQNTYIQTREVVELRASALDIELVSGTWKEFQFDDSFFGALIQYPDNTGSIADYSEFVKGAQSFGARVAVASDLMALAVLTSPGEWGADAVVGNSQRFGVPLGFGGPHAAFFATKEEFKRFIPGRIIGVSQDRNGNPALRMALQTREQHIKRDRATSNICTAQALLATMAAMYAVYHGPEGIRNIASEIHHKTTFLANELKALNWEVKNAHWFDTLSIAASADQQKEIREKALAQEVNFWYTEDAIMIALDETVGADDLKTIVSIFGGSAEWNGAETSSIPSSLVRQTEFMTHPSFNSYHSESEMMRYLKSLENKDISLTHSMISLGSCTMKLNAATELYPVSFPEFASLHPFVPMDQAEGYKLMIDDLSHWLCEVTGFAAISFQPNSGAQGEYAGLLTIDAYHKDRGDHHRNISLIPQSAHGTNPASAVMAGMEVVVVKCDEAGNIDVDDLREKAEKHKENLSCLMVTYPSTHGVYEEAIMEITDIIHQNGGLVYMDGANMNAQVGLTNPATIGADVCHLNLHKTFAIPHGGGGPGVGPIGVAAHLAPFLPGHALQPTGGEKAIKPVSAAPWGSSSILLISYAYVKMLGGDGLKAATEYAILNANYLKNRLEGHYPILYVGGQGRVAHEMIVDFRDFKKNVGVEVVDIAKRLIDFGFHAPTVSFPVAGTLMIEPTESESKAELDRFCEALMAIREEIQAIEDGKADAENNVLKNAPHRAADVVSSEWDKPYSREDAAFRLPWVMQRKYWVPVARIDDGYGDRNLMCVCPPLENYTEETSV